MRRIVLLAALALLLAAPTTVSAKHTLKHRVAALETKVKCLKRTGMATLVGYAYYDEAGDVVPSIDWESDLGLIGANFTHLVGPPADYWLIAINNTRACRKAFGVVRNPYSLRASARAFAQANARRLANLQ